MRKLTIVMLLGVSVLLFTGCSEAKKQTNTESIISTIDNNSIELENKEKLKDELIEEGKVEKEEKNVEKEEKEKNVEKKKQKSVQKINNSNNTKKEKSSNSTSNNNVIKEEQNDKIESMQENKNQENKNDEDKEDIKRPIIIPSEPKEPDNSLNVGTNQFPEEFEKFETISR